MIYAEDLKHLADWIEAHIYDDEKETVTNTILTYISKYPTVVNGVRSYTWREILTIARREGF